jgi:GNAT superfamily N-acetyltransferase
MSNFSIVKEHPALLKYVESLQAENSDALGFLPKMVFEHRAEAGQLFLGLLDGEPCGYILVGTGFQGVMRCVQVAIQYDVRRRLYGAMLVAAVEQYGEDRGCSRISLRCGSDLPTNEFWQSLGYMLDAMEESGAARRHRRNCINVWSKPLFPAIVATAWKNGRPRIYASNAERQAAYELRRKARDEANGIVKVPGVIGRPRIYATNTDRQRAYEQRKRLQAITGVSIGGVSHVSLT